MQKNTLGITFLFIVAACGEGGGNVPRAAGGHTHDDGSGGDTQASGGSGGSRQSGAAGSAGASAGGAGATSGAGECTPGLRSCDGAQPLECDTAGQWQPDGSACAGTCAAGTCLTTDSCQVLHVVYRDFKGSGEVGGHPDFELSATKVVDGMPYGGWNDLGCGMVDSELGANDKPVFYAGTADRANETITVPSGAGRQQRMVTGPGCWPNDSGTCFVGNCVSWSFNVPVAEITSASSFSQWYSHVPGVNQELSGAIELVETAAGSGVYAFSSDAFFPLDGLGFGTTPGTQHNYHFTSEVRARFTYQAGQKITFEGDDDVWIFINGKLAADLGGVHQKLRAVVDLDAQAGALGIVPGATYDFSLFHAERQSPDSHFSLETNISCFQSAVF